jgi:hypothetical protein
MKKITITIEVEDIQLNSGFASSVLDEIEKDRHNLEIVTKINKETTGVHYKFLLDLVETLNKELAPLGLSFGKCRLDVHSNNGYKYCLADMHLSNDVMWRIYVGQFCSDKNSPYKYSVHTRTPDIKIGNGSPMPSGCHFNEVDQILPYMRDSLIRHLKRVNT